MACSCINMSSSVSTYIIRASRIISIYDSAGDALTWQESTCGGQRTFRVLARVSRVVCVSLPSLGVWTVSGGKSYIRGERLAGCILDNWGGFRFGEGSGLGRGGGGGSAEGVWRSGQ